MDSPATGRLTPPAAELPPLERLRTIMAQLRSPEGCPWDREQSHQTLRGNLLEEAYETVAAIEAGDDANLCEELGDLLLQVVFHSQLASEEGRWTLDDVATGITEKLIRRHPHVFAQENAATSGAVLTRWEEIKRQEKAAAGKEAHPSALGEFPAGLPSLMAAEKVQKRAGKVGFDWEGPEPVLEKVREELAEVERAHAQRDQAQLEDELGDLLFSVVNLARHLKVEPEVALRRATEKFTRRFHAVEALAAQRGLPIPGSSLEAMDRLWAEVKQQA